MIDWTWNRESVKPADILNGMNTLAAGPIHYARFADQWQQSSTYLTWAKEALARADEAGFDMAISYAKRAVCRQIDGFVVHNHLGRLLGKKYTAKVDALKQIGLQSSRILHEDIIDPRNDIEHQYQPATSTQAHRAVDMADIYIGSTAHEAERGSIIGYGWVLSCSRTVCDKPNEQWERNEFTLPRNSDAMLLVDVVDTQHKVLILRPRAGELLECPLDSFTVDESVEFARRLRTQLKGNEGNHWTHTPVALNQLRDQLGLREFPCTASCAVNSPNVLS